MTSIAKLVRDRIPQIIRERGGEPITTIAAGDEYRSRLRDKFAEEVGESLDAATDGAAIEELADVLEVVQALAGLHGADPALLEKVRAAKAAERGGFTQGIVWHGNRAA